MEREREREKIRPKEKNQCVEAKQQRKKIRMPIYLPNVTNSRGT